MENHQHIPETSRTQVSLLPGKRQLQDSNKRGNVTEERVIFTEERVNCTEERVNFTDAGDTSASRDGARQGHELLAVLFPLSV